MQRYCDVLVYESLSHLGETTPDEVNKYIQNIDPSYSLCDIRDTIMRLINRDEIELTSKRTIRLPE